MYFFSYFVTGTEMFITLKYKISEDNIQSLYTDIFNITTTEHQTYNDGIINMRKKYLDVLPGLQGSII